MANIDTITDLAQDIYLIKNDSVKDVASTELAVFLSTNVRYINMWIEEYELEADWNAVRENDVTFTTIADVTVRTIPITDATVRTLAISSYRPMTISQDGTVISTFQVVSPDQIGDPADPDTRDRATVIGRKIILSRNLTDQELGGTVKADVIHFFKKITNDATFTDISVLSLIAPIMLLKLGVAKNSTLPNVIQGTLSPSYNQKYTDMLTKAVAKNNATSEAYDAQFEDLSFVGGLY